MEQLIINGVDASGTIDPPRALYGLIKSIEIDYPSTHSGVNDPSVTLSGSVTGAKTFYGDTTLDLKFYPSEDINITTNNFSGEYSAIIRYVYGGDMTCAMKTRDQYQKRPTPWRFRD